GRIGSRQFDYQTVVTHELAHAIGLYHDTNYYAVLNDGYDVMYPALSTGVIRRNISIYDNARLMHLYAHGVDPGSNGVPQSADGLHLLGFVPADDLPLPTPTAMAIGNAAALPGITGSAITMTPPTALEPTPFHSAARSFALPLLIVSPV